MIVITTNEYSSGDFNRLYDNSWSGAKQTLDDIANANKEKELMDFLDEVFSGEVGDTELNDFLWFDREYIYEALGLDENGELTNDDDDF